MRRQAVAAGCAVLLTLAACGDGKASVDIAVADSVGTSSTSTTPPSTSTTSSTTTSTSTSTSTSTTTTSSTTTTVADTLPNPESPPVDPRADVPLVEVGSIEIPKLGVTKPVFEGITLTTLDHGPGHWPGTAMPGHQGNVVIAGHRVSHDKPFRHLERLEVDDEVILTTAEGRFVYKVTGIEVVYPDALWIADQTTDYTATLFACHPAGSTRQRIVVHLAFAPDA
jgi:sortase A